MSRTDPLNMEEKQIKKIEKSAPALNIETLINQAVSANAPVESLERLLAMRKELKAEWAKEQFDKALSAFQGECPVIEKNKKVDFTAKSGVRTKYNYAPLEVIVEQVKPFLTKHGFSYMFDTETNGKMKVICKVKHLAGHSEITTFDMEIDQDAKMNVSQKYGAALTYAKRYAFCAAFAINVKDEDTDANTEQESKSPRTTEDNIDIEWTREDESLANESLNKPRAFLKCSVCDAEIKQNVSEYSLNKYGKELCFSCQKKAN